MQLLIDGMVLLHLLMLARVPILVNLELVHLFIILGCNICSECYVERNRYS